MDFDNLSQRVRNKIRKCLKNCIIKKVDSKAIIDGGIIYIVKNTKDMK